MASEHSVKTAVNSIKWFHQIDLGGGLITPGVDRSAEKLRRLGLPTSLSGKTVLDVGAWDGFFSFEAERRGAARVLATDSYCWSGPGWGSKAGFELARAILHSKVEDHEIDVLDLSPERVGEFDIVLFLGVLYHMRHPLLALERVASVCRDMLVVETESAHLLTRSPAMLYYLEGDDWCAPSVKLIRLMLEDVGFKRIEIVATYSLPKRIARAAWWRLTRGRPFWRSLARGRLVVHAYK